MFTPSQDSARIGATPLFNFMLLIGLWATLAPRSASSGISLGDNHTQCAKVVFGVSSPTSSSQRIIEPPCSL